MIHPSRATIAESEASTVTAMSSHYVEVLGLEKTYASPRGPVIALEGINLDIRQGEFLSVVGPSGCGKSTLLKCIAGLESISGGAIRINGRPLDGPPNDMGIVFQRDVLLDWRTILNNVLINAEFRNLDVEQHRPRALELLKLLGIDQSAHRHPWELSGGMRQRAAICRALLCNPDFLLMDEPFGALDAMTRDDLNVELTRIWQETKKTILFITHSIVEAVFLSDRIVMMSANPGKIVEVIEVNLPRPRRLAIRETSEFGRYSGYIRELFKRQGMFKEEA